MSTIPRTDRPSSAQTFPTIAAHLARVTSALTAATVTGVRALAFWVAVLLPLSYLPLLVDGLGASESIALAGLVAVNALALVVGHDYDPGV